MSSRHLGMDRPTKQPNPAAAELGREALRAWEQAQPSNYLSADLNLQRTLEYHWGLETYRAYLPALIEFGGLAATKIDGAVRTAARSEGLPQLDRFDSWGRRKEQVRFHPSHHEAGRLIIGSGMMSAYETAGGNLKALSLFYLSSQNGEAGHNCSLACTAGVIKTLKALTGPRLADRYLPRLYDDDYDSCFQGAQFVTEVQGGSDVGANAMLATLLREDEKSWILNGEKWFCSNVTADLALVTARVPGQGAGTGGLGLFLVPRRLQDGRLNEVYIHRLKDKLGTRLLATGELSFRDALAYQVGPTEAGFKNLMRFVINTSRVYNAVAACGAAHRAWRTAASYAQHRRAFGKPIIHYPLVQDQLANMRATSAAILAGTFQIVHLIDEIEAKGSNEEADGFLRMAINLSKYRSALLSRQVILGAIELLGGNGAIETFSVLPRLLRDNVVYENWEGTHNVLLAQVQRDARRYMVHVPFLKALRRLLANASEEIRAPGLELQARMASELDEVLAMDELTAAIYFRPLMDRLMDLYYAACLAAEAEWETSEKKDRTKGRLATMFFNRQARGREPKDIAYYDDQVSRLSR